MVSSYPVQFDVDFPDRPLDRLKTAFRFFLAIPIVIVLSLLSGQAFGDNGQSTEHSLVIGGAAVFLPLVLMILFRRKYPRWWFDWNLNLIRFYESSHGVHGVARRPLSLDRRGAVGASGVLVP
jgi:hypothetical protein